MSHTSPDPLETWVRQTAEQLGLPLREAHVPGVVENYRRLSAQAALLMAHPLAEADEPAPVFRP